MFYALANNRPIKLVKPVISNNIVGIVYGYQTCEVCMLRQVYAYAAVVCLWDKFKSITSRPHLV